MLANFFGKSKPVNFILITVLFLIYYILDFITRGNFEINLQLFYSFLMLTSLFLLLFFLFNFIISKNKLTRDNSYAFLLFIFGLGFLETVITEISIVSTYLVLFLFFRRVYSLRTSKIVYQKLFDSGFWLGILFLVSPFYLLYAALMYAAVFFFSKITIRTVLIPIVGCSTPVFLYFTYLFWTDDVSTFYQLFDIVFTIDFSFYNTVYYAIFTLTFAIVTSIALLLRTGKVLSVSNRFKRSWVLLLLHLIISVVFISLVQQKNGTELISFLFPSAIIIANWLQFITKKSLINVVILLFLGLSFAIHFIA